MALITQEAQIWDLPPPDPGVTDLQPWPALVSVIQGVTNSESPIEI